MAAAAEPVKSSPASCSKPCAPFPQSQSTALVPASQAKPVLSIAVMAAAGKEEKTGTDKERDKEIEAQLERGEGDGQGNIEEWPIGAQTAAPTSTATPTAAATAVQTPAAAEFPVLHALAAKHSEYKWISIHEGSHSHYHFAQPALELVPNKLACVEWLLVKQRAVPNNKIRALGSDVQLCGANSKDGHWLLVCDIYVLHFKSRGALRVELLVYDAADGRCFTEQITNVTSIVDRTSTPPLTPSALTLIENSEDLVEHEVKDKEAEKAHDDKRVAAADTRSNIDLSAAVSPVGSSSHRLSPRAHARASYKESELQGEAATMGIGSDSGGERKVPRRGLTKAGVSKMISAAIKGTQDRLTRALKRDHDELLAAIGAAKHEQPPAKRPKVLDGSGSSAPVLAQIVGPRPLQQNTAAAPARLPLAELQMPANAGLELLQHDADMAQQKLRIDHALLREEVDESQQHQRLIDAARLLALSSYRSGFEEGRRTAEKEHGH